MAHRAARACPTKVDTGFVARHAQKQKVRVCLAILSAPDRLYVITRNGEDAELTYCAEQDWMTADAALNDAYQAAMAAMKQVDSGLEAKDRGAVVNLRAAQRAWITFRDAACAAEGYPMHGGSAEPMVIYACRARLTDQRAEDLGYLGAAE